MTRSTIEIKTPFGAYQAERDDDNTVRIYRDNCGRWEYAGQGRLDAGAIVDCAAELVPGSADATEEVFEALEQELVAAWERYCAMMSDG